MSDSLERIYGALPKVDCKGLCAESCGPIGMSSAERARVERRGVEIPSLIDAMQSLADGNPYDCPALVEGRCTIYEDRPLVCRMWGAVESMPCVFGCDAEPGLLRDSGARVLLQRADKLIAPILTASIPESSGHV